MRDYVQHTDLIQAGLWGGLGGIFPSLDVLLKQFVLRQMPHPMIDQQFLMYHVWPTVRQSVLTHDSCFGVLGAKPFPADFGNAGQHLGVWARTGSEEKKG